MHKYVLPLALVASISASSLALAATDKTVTGTIASMDAKLCTLTLDNKRTYYFAKKCDFSALKVGEKVAVTWHLYKKIEEIDVGTKVAAAPAPAPVTTTTTAKKP